MSDAVLRDRLLATVPPLDDADWLGVRRRARAITARRRNRRLLVLAAALAILTALVVNPALGIGERLLDFVEGDPAPEGVRKAFRAQGPSELRVGHRVFKRPKPPPPNLVDAHLAVALDSSVGPVYLWVADGGACMLLEIESVPDLPGGRPNAGGGCSTALSAEMPINPSGGATRVGQRYFNYIQGRVHANIARLEATLSDGRKTELRLVEGFFLAELPASTLAERVAGCEPVPEPPLLTSGRRETRDPASIPCFVRAVEYRGFDTNGSLVERFQSRRCHVPRGRLRPSGRRFPFACSRDGRPGSSMPAPRAASYVGACVGASRRAEPAGLCKSSASRSGSCSAASGRTRPSC